MALIKEMRFIVGHCSATPPSMDIGWQEIDEWHRSAPRYWRAGGYHEIIRRSGDLELGRDPTEAGAHVAQWNRYSLGICLIGGIAELEPGQTLEDAVPEFNYTDAQMDMLRERLHFHWLKHPHAQVMGHFELDDRKTCPNFTPAQLLAAASV